MIYENIAKLCEKKGLTIMALEKNCGLGNGTVGGWKSGHPRVDRLKAVADYLGVTLDELTRETDESD